MPIIRKSTDLRNSYLEEGERDIKNGNFLTEEEMDLM